MGEVIRLSEQYLQTRSKVADIGSKNKHETMILLNQSQSDGERVTWWLTQESYDSVSFHEQDLERISEKMWSTLENSRIDHQHPDKWSLVASKPDLASAWSHETDHWWKWDFWIYKSDVIWWWEISVWYDKHNNLLKQSYEKTGQVWNVITTWNDWRLNKYLKNVWKKELYDTDKMMLKAELSYIQDNNEFTAEDVNEIHGDGWEISTVRKRANEIMMREKKWWNVQSIDENTDEDKDYQIEKLMNRLAA